MEKDLTSSSKDARTYPSLLKMTAVMLGAWEVEAVASTITTSATEEATKEVEAVAVAATEVVEVAVATTTTPAEAMVEAAIKLEVVVEAEEAAVAVVVTMTVVMEVATTEVTKATLVAASTTAHQVGEDLKQHLLRETSTPTTTTTTMMEACPAVTEDREVLPSLLVEVEAEVAASPTVEEAEVMEVTVADMVARLLIPVVSTLLRVSPTTLLLPTTTTVVVDSREEELPVDLPHKEDRAASTNRSLPILTRNPKPAVESPALCTSETSTRTPLTLLSLNSLANRTLKSR